MAVFKTDLMEAQENGLLKDRMPASKGPGELRTIEATYTTTGTEANDDIEICKLPVGAVVLAEEIKVVNAPALGGTTLQLQGIRTGDIIFSDTPFTLHSSNGAIQSPTPENANLLNREAISEGNDIVKVTTDFSAAPTAGKKVKFILVYRLP